MRRLDGAGSHVVGKNTNFGRFYGVVIARCAFTAPCAHAVESVSRNRAACHLVKTLPVRAGGRDLGKYPQEKNTEYTSSTHYEGRIAVHFSVR